MTEKNNRVSANRSGHPVAKPKRPSLGLPLALVSVGVVASLFIGKKVHVGLGIAWGVLSLLHGIQHSKKLRQDARNLLNAQI